VSGSRFNSPRRLSVCAAACVLLACSDPVGSDTPYVVTPVSSATVAGTPGWTLTDTLVVEVRDAQGHIVPGVKVQWSVPNGGSLAVQLADADSRLTGTTDDRGRNYAVWTLGLNEGTQVARAAAGTESIVSFTATATALHAVDVTMGYDYACAVLTDQRPVCWGGNFDGQLGVGDMLVRTSPTGVQGLVAVREIKASQGGHTCARDLAGDVWCWGRSFNGEAGSLASSRQLVPVRVPGAQGASTLEVGYLFSCAILNVGGARCWGSNDGGRLGAGVISFGGLNYPVPQVVVGGGSFVSLGLDTDRACALDSDHEVWCWGRAFGGEFSPYPANAYNTPVQPIPGYKFYEVGLNYYTNCGIAVGGVVLCWGMNVGLGEGTGPELTPAPTQPQTGATFADLSGGGGVMYGRTRDGRLFAWGYEDGFGSGPPRVVQSTTRAIDAAGSGGYGYCIIAEGGALYCDHSWDGRGGLKAFPATPIP
jgi:hypothetical protein